MSKKVKMVQRADNQILFYWVEDAIAQAGAATRIRGAGARRG